MKIIIFLFLFLLSNIDLFGGVIIRPLKKDVSYIITNDEKYLIEINGKILRFYDHQSRSFLSEGSSHKEVITKYQISEDNRKIITCSNDGVLNLWEIKSGRLLHCLMGHTDFVSSFNFSSDGKFILTSSFDNTVRIWNTENGTCLQVIKLSSRVKYSEFSKDGKLFLTKDESTVKIWNTNNFQNIRFYESGKFGFSKFSPNGKYLLISNKGLINVYDIAANKKILDLDCSNDFVSSISFSADKEFILTAGARNNILIIWDASTFKEIKRFESATEHLGKYEFNNCGDILCDKNQDADQINKPIELIDGKTGKLLSKGQFFNSNGLFDVDNGIIHSYSFIEKKYADLGFFYVLLESRPRIFLISCAADKYNPPLSNLQKCTSDAARIIKYFEKSKGLEKQIEEIKALITKNLNFPQKAKLDSLQLLLSKTPILISERLYNYDLNKNSIIKAFNNVKNQMRFDDAFVFHFSGMGGTIKNTEVSTLFFSSDTSTFTADDLFQLSEIINGNNQLFLLDACQDNFINHFKSEILNNKVNSQLINRNRVLLAIKGIAVDNYKGTGGGALTHAFVNNNIPFNQVFSFDSREKNEFDYNLYNGTKELKEDRFINFEIFRESDYYDVKFKEKNKSRGVILSTEEKLVEKPNTISKGQTLSVVVGVNAYSNLTTLTNPLLDAEKIAKILESQYGHKVILLKDINYMSLADSLFAVIEKYEFNEGSQFLFYFAGHGGFNKYDNSSCLLFRDSKLNSSGIFDNAMSSAMLKGLINQIKATRTMVVIDACHSRKLTEECKEAECMALDQSKEFDEKVMDSYLKSPGKVIFTSANVFQEASDGDPYKYSPFANAFIASLEERSLKKIEFDSKAVYKDMLNYQSDKTKNKHFQSEMKYCSYNDSNKDDDRFIFIPK